MLLTASGTRADLSETAGEVLAWLSGLLAGELFIVGLLLLEAAGRPAFTFWLPGEGRVALTSAEDFVFCDGLTRCSEATDRDVLSVEDAEGLL